MSLQSLPPVPTTELPGREPAAPSPDGAGKPLPGAQTFARGLQLLQYLVQADGPRSLADITRDLGLNKNAAHRLLRELETQAFVARESGSRRYVLGDGLVAMAAIVVQRNPVRTVARPFLLRIADLSGETTALHMHDTRYRTCVDVVEGKHPVRRVVQVGERLPIYSGSSGKVQLAFLPPPVRRNVLTWAADEGVDIVRLERELDQIRATGYMAAIADRTPGVGGLSIPISKAEGVIAAVTVSGPAERWGMDAMLSSVPDIVRECVRLSAQLGGTSPP